VVVAGDVNEADGTGLRLMQIRTVSLDTSAVLPHQVTKPLPPDCPSWAASLNDCEVSSCKHGCMFILSD